MINEHLNTLCQPISDSLEKIFPGDSELANLMRTFNWSATSLGHPTTWPQNLQIALGICLTSRFPLTMWWGPSFILLYNDAYIPFLGPYKHPSVLGGSGKEAWREIWPTIGPMVESAINNGDASWSEDIQMFIDRNLQKEEVYVTFSISPIFNENKTKVDGLFCACTETTEKLVSNRRLEILRKLGIEVNGSPTVKEACIASVEVLTQISLDIPFAAVYVADENEKHLKLYATTGLAGIHPLPESASLSEREESSWQLVKVFTTKVPADINLQSIGVELRGNPWPESSPIAIVLPILGITSEKTAGLLVVGISPRRVLDNSYRSFFELIAAHIGNAIASAHAYESERKKAEVLAELDRAKTTFFNNISHEFRTPLTLMLAPLEDSLECINKSNFQPIKSMVETAHRNTLRLLKLVNTLLDFSRIEAGRIEANYEPIKLSRFTMELASIFRSTIERAGLEYEVQCNDISELVYVDKEMWEKIVLNLISNAYKFTFQGKISVHLVTEMNQVILTVKDTGTGISTEQLPRIFERFHRIEGAKARTHEGSGIGLALVQELVHIHNGEIAVNSKLNDGTTFKVSIPLGKTHLPEEKISIPRLALSPVDAEASIFVSEAEKWYSGENEIHSFTYSSPHTEVLDEIASATILVADDNADMRGYLTRLLNQKWNVKSVHDGEAALTALKQGSFDLVLADIMMPILDGFGLLKKLRADPLLKNIPLIMLSARAGEESRIEGLQAGADDYLIKPFSAKEVLARVETHLRLSSRRKLAADHAALKRLHEVSSQLVSEEALATLLQAVVDAAITVCDADMGILQLYEQDSHTLRVVAETGFKSEFLNALEPITHEHSCACGEALRTGERVIVEDVYSNPLYIESPILERLNEAGVRAVQSTPLKSRKGKLLGMISTQWKEPKLLDERTLQILDLLARKAADLIEHRQRETALQHAKDEAEQSSKAKDLFLAILSHELRTPLTVILSWAQMLQMKNSDPGILAKGIRSIEESALSQNQLIEDLLDISRIIMGKLSVELQYVNVITILKQTIDSISPAAAKKRIEIKEDLSVPEVFISADSARLKQIFWNILSNAIKFTPNYGRIEIKISLSLKVQTQFIHISIIDNGKGIKPEFIPLIFDRFAQIDSSSTRTHGGLGLGLALVHSLLKLQGGEIEASSQGENRGSTFIVTFPLIESDQILVYRNQNISPSHDGTSIENTYLQGIKLLLVDDGEQTREVLCSALFYFGAQVCLAASVKEALDIYQENPPDIIVSDIAMPEEDGYDLIYKLRQTEHYKKKKSIIIALTAYAGSDNFEKAISAGFDYHLAKPVDIIKLVVLIKEKYLLLHSASDCIKN